MSDNGDFIAELDGTNEPEKRCKITTTTTGEFDLRASVAYLDEDDEIIDWVMDFDGDDAVERATEWAKANGYEIVGDKDDEDLGARTSTLVVVYITPNEVAKQVNFKGFPNFGDPEDYKRQVENFIGERSCCQPYIMAVFQEKDSIPVFCSSDGDCLPLNTIQLG